MNSASDPIGQNSDAQNNARHINPGQNDEAAAVAGYAGAPANLPAANLGQMNTQVNQGINGAGGGSIPDMSAAMMNNMWANPMIRMQLMQNMPFWGAGMMPMGMVGMVSPVHPVEARRVYIMITVTAFLLCCLRHVHEDGRYGGHGKWCLRLVSTSDDFAHIAMFVMYLFL